MELTTTPSALASNSGFQDDGLPLLFNRYRHRGGLSSWDSANVHLFETSKAQSNPDMIRIALYYHQLAGVHALLRMLFGPDPDPERCLGALIADEVGLGKRFLATTLIISLTDLVMRQKLTVKAPMLPIIGEIDSSLRVMRILVF